MEMLSLDFTSLKAHQHSAGVVDGIVNNINADNRLSADSVGQYSPKGDTYCLRQRKNGIQPSFRPPAPRFSL